MAFDQDGAVGSNQIRQQVRRHLHDHWKAYAFQGGLMALVGFIALIAPFLATLASTIFFGWLLMILGVVGIVAAFRTNGSSGFWSNLLLAVLALVLGFVILFDPFAGAVTLTWMLAVYFLLTGLANFTLARAFRASHGGSFWLLILSGVLNVALALFLVLGLPGTAVWAVGLFLGISLLMSGISLLVSALSARNAPAPDSRF